MASNKYIKLDKQTYNEKSREFKHEEKEQIKSEQGEKLEMHEVSFVGGDRTETKHVALDNFFFSMNTLYILYDELILDIIYTYCSKFIIIKLV